MAMKLSTGKVAFPIEFDNGDKDCIYFNPNDRNFITRVMDFENGMNKRIQALKVDKYKDAFENSENIAIDIDNIDSLLDLSKEETDAIKNKAKAVLEIDKMVQDEVKKELNDIFDCDVSSVIFKYCGPLDSIVTEEGKSELFVIHFIRCFAKEVKDYTTAHGEAINKYTRKYEK